MILSAVVLLNNHLFTEKFTLVNLGGPHFYELEEQDENFSQRAISLTRKINKNFIRNFYNHQDSQQIQNLSAIVGGNGVGKTTVLNSIREDTNSANYQHWQNSILIFETPTTGDIYTNHYQGQFYDEETEYSVFDNDHLKPNLFIEVIENGQSLHISQLDNDDVRSIYYSPHLAYHYDSNESNDQYDISITKNIIEDLEEFGNKDNKESGFGYHPYEEIIFNNMEKQLYFLNSKIAINPIISEIFKLPKYNTAKLIIRKYNRTTVFDNLPNSFRPFFREIASKIGDEKSKWKDQSVFKNGKEKNQLGIEKHFLKLYIIESYLSLLTEQFEKHNTYLEEGTVNGEDDLDFDEYTAAQLFFYFIENSYVDDKKIFHSEPSRELLETLFKFIDEATEKNDVTRTSFVTSVDNIRKILQLQRTVLISLFNYYPKYSKQLINPENYVSSFIHFSPSKENLSSGQHALLNLFSNLYHFVYTKLQPESQSITIPKSFLILLDEADLGFHPLWKKKYIKALINSITLFFKGLAAEPKLQLIIATHDPISLSDVLSQNVVYIYSNDLGKSKISDSTMESGDKRTFAANISELLADSFFLDGLIGDFALDKINETIYWINENREAKGNINTEKLYYYKKVIANIDERVIKMKLSEMISELEEGADFQKQIIDEEIRFLEAKRIRLK